MTDMFFHQRNSEQGTPSRNFPIKKNDLILILVLLIFSVFFGILYCLTASPGQFVAVTVDGEEIGSYPLNRDEIVEIRTKYGENILVIENGKAFVRSADCPNGICCAHNPISREGEIIACYPHKVIIVICAE